MDSRWSNKSKETNRKRKRNKVEQEFDEFAAPKFALSSLSNMPQNMV